MNIVRIDLLLMILRYTTFLKLYFFNFLFKTIKGEKSYNILPYHVHYSNFNNIIIIEIS